MEKKLTAVEWLMEQVNSSEYQKAFGQTYVSVELIEQAKEMEKEQIFHFTMEYIDENLIHFGKIRFADTPEDYYNEFYNQEK